jgi:hypothetical protein
MDWGPLIAWPEAAEEVKVGADGKATLVESSVNEKDLA